VPGKSMVPLLSASTSLIMSWSSDSLGFWPSERMTVPSSLVVIWPVRHGGQWCPLWVPCAVRLRRGRVLTIAVLVLQRNVVSWLSVRGAGLRATRQPRGRGSGMGGHLQTERRPP
jgi:hypothetical protein